MSASSEESIAIQPRTREVWTREEQKTLNRALWLLVSRNLSTELHCTLPGCAGVVEREANASGFDLTCECKRRVFYRHQKGN